MPHITVYTDPTDEHRWKAIAFDNSDSAGEAARMLYATACDHDFGRTDDAGFAAALANASELNGYISAVPVDDNMVIHID